MISRMKTSGSRTTPLPIMHRFPWWKPRRDEMQNHLFIPHYQGVPALFPPPDNGRRHPRTPSGYRQSSLFLRRPTGRHNNDVRHDYLLAGFTTRSTKSSLNNSFFLILIPFPSATRTHRPHRPHNIRRQSPASPGYSSVPHKRGKGQIPPNDIPCRGKSSAAEALR